VIVTYWKGVFVVDSKPEDRAKLERAGFEMHEPSLCAEPSRCKGCKANIGRRYWSARVEAATRLRSCCNERALSVMREHLDRLAKSRAVDSSIVVPCPPGLQYEPYQLAGISYAMQHKDTLIGDAPGLGKTIESLGVVNKLGDAAKSVLVVGPATLTFNWKDEAEKWLMGDWKIFIPRSGADEVPATSGRILVITNYEKVSGKRVTPFMKSIERVWDVAIFDEAHALKTPTSMRSRAVLGERGLLWRAHRSLFLTGTPIENFPKEIWPLAAALCPAKFGDWDVFARRYCGLHQEERGDGLVWVATGGTNLGELQQRLRSTFMVRRLKEDVMKELPPKRRQLVVLGDEEVDWSAHPEFKKWKECYEKAWEAALARVEAAKTSTEYKSAVRDLDAVTGVAFTETSDLRHKTALVKLPMCLKYLDELLESTADNIVVFAHHNDVLEKLHEHFADNSVLLYGGTPMKDRGEVIRAFQAGEKRIFLGSLKAAGVGINLYRACIAVFCEGDWVPATMTQAEDRLCRKGQTKMVHVIHLALNGTLDVNMSKKVIAKQNAIDKALDHLPEQLRLQQVG
jgi:SWI/SNF-related matrix-associated actin-dependent regulator of chromatin subfamily A-like protein 1